MELLSFLKNKIRKCDAIASSNRWVRPGFGEGGNMRPTQLCAQPTASPTSVASPIAYIWQGSKYQMKLKSGDMVLAQDTAVVH